MSKLARPVLLVPELPVIPPHTLLERAWKPSHAKALLSSLGAVDPVVTRTARSISTQQVTFDGLVQLERPGVLELAVSSTMLPEALRVYNLLIQAVAKRGGSVSTMSGTAVILRGETINIRLREASERRPKQMGSSVFRDYEYHPTGLLSFVVDHPHGNKVRAVVRDMRDVESFLDRLERFAERLPRVRAQRRERERQREDEIARIHAKWQQEQDERRQWQEQQKLFDEVTRDVTQWAKARQVRAYGDAFERQYIAVHGTVERGGTVDGWVRWLHWYAEHLDPITRPDGPAQGPDDERSSTPEP